MRRGVNTLLNRPNNTFSQEQFRACASDFYINCEYTGPRVRFAILGKHNVVIISVLLLGCEHVSVMFLFRMLGLLFDLQRDVYAVKAVVMFSGCCKCRPILVSRVGCSHIAFSVLRGFLW